MNKSTIDTQLYVESRLIEVDFDAISSTLNCAPTSIRRLVHIMPGNRISPYQVSSWEYATGYLNIETLAEGVKIIEEVVGDRIDDLVRLCRASEYEISVGSVATVEDEWLDRPIFELDQTAIRFLEKLNATWHLDIKGYT